jgi:hypothetical protein
MPDRKFAPIPSFTCGRNTQLGLHACCASAGLAVAAFIIPFTYVAPLTSAQADRLVMLTVALCSAALTLAAVGAGAFIQQRRRAADSMITVCAWTRRVRWQGEWITMEDYLERRFDLECTHGICDEAAQRVRQDAVNAGLLDVRGA